MGISTKRPPGQGSRVKEGVLAAAFVEAVSEDAGGAEAIKADLMKDRFDIGAFARHVNAADLMRRCFKEAFGRTAFVPANLDMTGASTQQGGADWLVMKRALWIATRSQLVAKRCHELADKDLLEMAAQEAMRAGAAVIQKALGVETKTFEVMFAAGDGVDPIRTALRRYMLAEREVMKMRDMVEGEE